jgi:phospholipase/carboxylesterase
MNRLSSLGSSDSKDSRQMSDGKSPSPAVTLASLPSFAPQIDRPRRFFLPSRYEANYRYPLIVWLHGDGSNENEISQVFPHISTQNYVGVGIRGSRSVDPVGHRFDWASSNAALGRCEDAIFQAIEDAGKRYSIHRERVFLAGYGNGGTMARRVALRHGNVFAGCISLGGRFPDGGGIFSNLAASRSVRHFWGVAIENPALSHDDLASDIERVATGRLKMDIRRYTTDDEMDRSILRDVDKWVMGIVTGTAHLTEPQENWDTLAVGFSDN